MSRHIEVESETSASALGDVHARWKVADVRGDGRAWLQLLTDFPVSVIGDASATFLEFSLSDILRFRREKREKNGAARKRNRLKSCKFRRTHDDKRKRELQFFAQIRSPLLDAFCGKSAEVY